MACDFCSDNIDVDDNDFFFIRDKEDKVKKICFDCYIEYLKVYIQEKDDANKTEKSRNDLKGDIWG